MWLCVARAGTSEKRGIEILFFIDCTRRLCEKTVTKKNLVRQALISVHAEICDRHSGPFDRLRINSAKNLIDPITYTFEILRPPAADSE